LAAPSTTAPAVIATEDHATANEVSNRQREICDTVERALMLRSMNAPTILPNSEKPAALVVASRKRGLAMQSRGDAI
jgi:hypothetical protein